MRRPLESNYRNPAKKTAVEEGLPLDWEQKEKEFHLNQAHDRAQLRLSQGRGTVFDLLCLNTSQKSSVTWVFSDSPVELVEKCRDEKPDELAKLIQDAAEVLELETNLNQIEYWKSIILLSTKLMEQKKSGLDASNHDRHGSVKADIAALLKGKTFKQLSELAITVKEKLKSDDVIDVEYWQDLLGELEFVKVKVKIDELNGLMFKDRRSKIVDPFEFSLDCFLKNELPKKRKISSTIGQNGLQSQPKTVLSIDDDYSNATGLGNNNGKGLSPDQDATTISSTIVPPPGNPLPGNPLPGNPSPGNPLPGNLSPGNSSPPTLPPQPTSTIVLPAISTSIPSIINWDNSPAAIAMYTAEAKRHHRDGYPFNTEAEDVVPRTYPWESQYPPRKPRYFNLVRMNYEWNKYNQTHYDRENPPPKVVQGYRFNIFYPDLIDPSKTPTFKVYRDKHNGEMQLLRFVGGPPYEDVIFRIQNEEWDVSHRQGYKSVFEHGILRLYFWFKKQRYRR